MYEARTLHLPSVPQVTALHTDGPTSKHLAFAPGRSNRWETPPA